MKILKEDIKKKSFKPVYLLYGDESYLLEYYSKALLDAAVSEDNRLMNYDVFDGKNISTGQIMDAANTFPMSNAYRLVAVRNSGLFAMKKKGDGGDESRKADTEAMAAYLRDIPPATVLLFVETEIDKRSRLYKQVEKTGHAVPCVKPLPAELNKWVINIFKKNGKIIAPEMATVFLRTVLHGMTALAAEAEKLSAYAGEREEITAEDIAAVTSATLESQIFKLVDASARGEKPEALRLYGNMLLLKESPFMILTMITRQFRLILQCKAALEKNMRRYEIAQALGIRDFVADECINQGRNFSTARLVDALRSCRDMEVRIKSGMIDADTGVELLVLNGLG